MRLFTGIALTPHVLENLEALITELRSVAPVRWSPPANLHITTRFIGEWPEARLEELKTALAAIPCGAPIPVSLSGFGFMPNPHKPRVFFAGVHAGDLPKLAADTNQSLESLGCKRENRAYHPHLTLARIASQNIGELRERIANMKNSDFGSFEATEFHLYLSQPGAAGSVYTPLATFPFAGIQSGIQQ